MRRILFVDHTGQLGGAELSLYDLCCHYRDRCQVLLFEEGPFGARLKEAGVAVTVLRAPSALLGVRRRADWWAALVGGLAALRMALRVVPWAKQADLVHCNSQKAMLVGAVAGWLARRPVVWHLRDILTAPEMGRLNRWVAVRVANRLVTRVIANSHATAAAFVAAGGRRDRVTVLYNGIEPGGFGGGPGRGSGGALAPGPGIGPVIGCFSRLAPWKGQHVLIEAARLLRVRYPNVMILVAGSPLFGEGAYEERLHAAVAEAGLAQNVRLLGFRSDIPSLMAACDIIAHTSISPEPFGRVIAEGMMAGKPVVGAAAGGAAELVTDGETGLLVSPGNAAELAGAIDRLVRDPAFAQGIARAGQVWAREHLSLERHLDGFAQIIGASDPQQKEATSA